MTPHFDSLYEELHAPLTRRIQRLVGDRATAEDLRQETFARAWKSAPRDADRGHLRAWMHRTAHNLAIDELRKRRHRDWLPIEESLSPAAPGVDPDERLAAREALGRLSPHERLVLLLRFEGGLSHAEIGELLDISEEAARKRVARARTALRAADRVVTRRERPLVMVLMADDCSDFYDGWIRECGGEPRVVDRDTFERDITTADALVISGSHTDIDPRIYGQENEAAEGDLDLQRDVQDLRAVRLALAQDVPFVGVCRGHQLLNIAMGGTLHQDIGATHGPGNRYDEFEHPIGTASRSLARNVLGRSMSVASGHHQAVDRVGGGLRVTGGSNDGVIEAVEVPAHKFALGVQWHPERPVAEEAGRRLGEALIAAAA